MAKPIRSPAVVSDVPSVVTRGASTPEGKAELAKSYKQAVAYRDASVRYLQLRWHTLNTQQKADSAYDSPSWPFRQAAFNAQLQEIEVTLKNLFNVKVQHYGHE